MATRTAIFSVDCDGAALGAPACRHEAWAVQRALRATVAAYENASRLTSTLHARSACATRARPKHVRVHGAAALYNVGYGCQGQPYLCRSLTIPKPSRDLPGDADEFAAGIEDPRSVRSANQGRGRSEARWAAAARKFYVLFVPATRGHAPILARFSVPRSVVEVASASGLVAKLPAGLRGNRLLARNLFHGWRDGSDLRRYDCSVRPHAIRTNSPSQGADVQRPEAGWHRRRADANAGDSGRGSMKRIYSGGRRSRNSPQCWPRGGLLLDDWVAVRGRRAPAARS